MSWPCTTKPIHIHVYIHVWYVFIHIQDWEQRKPMSWLITRTHSTFTYTYAHMICIHGYDIYIHIWYICLHIYTGLLSNASVRANWLWKHTTHSHTHTHTCTYTIRVWINMQDWGAMQARELTDHLEDILETDEVDIIPGQCRVEVQLCLYTYLCVKFIYVLVCICVWYSSTYFCVWSRYHSSAAWRCGYILIYFCVCEICTRIYLYLSLILVCLFMNVKWILFRDITAWRCVYICVHIYECGISTHIYTHTHAHMCVWVCSARPSHTISFSLSHTHTHTYKRTHIHRTHAHIFIYMYHTVGIYASST